MSCHVTKAKFNLDQLGLRDRHLQKVMSVYVSLRFLTGASTTSLKTSKAKGTAEKQTAKQDSIVALEINC